MGHAPHQIKVVPEVQDQVPQLLRTLREDLDSLDGDQHARDLKLAKVRPDARRERRDKVERESRPFSLAGTGRAGVVEREGGQVRGGLEERLEGGEEGGEGWMAWTGVGELDRA